MIIIITNAVADRILRHFFVSFICFFMYFRINGHLKSAEIKSAFFVYYKHKKITSNSAELTRETVFIYLHSLSVVLSFITNL